MLGVAFTGGNGQLYLATWLPGPRTVLSQPSPAVSRDPHPSPGGHNQEQGRMERARAAATQRDEALGCVPWTLDHAGSGKEAPMPPDQFPPRS